MEKQANIFWNKETTWKAAENNPKTKSIDACNMNVPGNMKKTHYVKI